MDTQLSLFDGAGVTTTKPTPRPFGNAAVTRVAAQTAIKPTVTALRAKVLTFIRGRGDFGATDEEVQDALGLAGNTQRPRRKELQDGGHIIESGHTRLTKSRRAATVWVAVAAVDQAPAGEPQEEPPF